MLIDHDVGLEKNYYRPTDDDLLQEYLKAVDLLTIEESHRLRRKVRELTEQQDEITLMKINHDKQMNEIREHMKRKDEEQTQKLERIISLIRENPRLAKVKTIVLKDQVDDG